MTRKSPSPRRPYVRFTRWRRAHFFRVLEETGHVQMAAEAAGVSLGCIYRLRRVEAGFTEKMVAAVEKANARLQRGEQPSGVTVTGTGTGTRQQALVIRRGIKGRLRVMAAGLHWWTERHDAVFFAHLRATGSVAASARAAGFTPKSAWNRRDRLPGFARAMDEAREDADLALEFQLSVEAQRNRGDDYRPGSEPGVPAEQAFRTLSFRDNRKRGKHSPRRAKPPGIEAVTEKIERKVRAIRRHRERKG
jgi:molybdenum-dependent DNA-binding transcriptional regulator ModE